MAFPTVQTADIQGGTVSTNSASWTLTYPTNLASGDLIFAVMGVDGNVTPTFPAGWVSLASSAGPVTGIVAKKVSNGAETGTFSVGLSAAEQGGWRIYRITGWQGTLGTTFDNTANAGAVVASLANGSGSAPPSSNLDPLNWAAEDTYWFAGIAIDTSRTVTTFPTNFTNTGSHVSGGSNGATIGYADRSINASNQTVNGWTFTSDDYVRINVAVRPAAAATTVTGSFTANAVLVGGGTGSFTADSVVNLTTRPTWVSPSQGASINDAPTLVAVIPTSPTGIHFHLQLDTSNTFDTVNLRDRKSSFDQTGWEYFNGTTWTPIPAGGVSSTFIGNQVRYTVQTPLSTTTWYGRIRAGS